MSSSQTDVTPSPTTTQKIGSISLSVTADSQLGFVTATTLVIASAPTTTVIQTQTNPDAVPATTLTIPNGPMSAPPAVPTLPPNLPSKLFPPGSIAQPGQGDALISILFTLELNWAFIIKNDQASGQLFIYAPIIISTALGLDRE
jgi:hypothetical protein